MESDSVLRNDAKWNADYYLQEQVPIAFRRNGWLRECAQAAGRRAALAPCSMVRLRRMRPVASQRQTGTGRCSWTTRLRILTQFFNQWVCFQQLPPPRVFYRSNRTILILRGAQSCQQFRSLFSLFLLSRHQLSRQVSSFHPSIKLPTFYHLFRFNVARQARLYHFSPPSLFAHGPLQKNNN